MNTDRLWFLWGVHRDGTWDVADSEGDILVRVDREFAVRVVEERRKSVEIMKNLNERTEP